MWNFAYCDLTSKSRLNVAYNVILRYVYGIKRYEDISQHSKSLYGVELMDLLKIKALILLQKVIYTRDIHTYIIGHYNPSVRIIDLVSHTTYVVCVNFFYLQFKVDSERQTWETFSGNFIYSQSFCQKSAERKSPKKYFSYCVLMSGLGLEPWLFV